MTKSVFGLVPTKKIFELYEEIVSKADRAFESMKKESPDEVRCKLHCTDCCYAVFGLFLIEAVRIRNQFELLDEKTREGALARCESAEKDLALLQQKLEKYKNDSEQIIHLVGRQRIRCPLLGENDECILYGSRPITCRVYGIPATIRGKSRVCSKAGFKGGKYYSSFDLDQVNKQLYMLSKAFLERIDGTDPSKASLLLAMPRILKTPTDDLIAEVFR